MREDDKTLQERGALSTHKIVGRYMKSVGKGFFDAYIYVRAQVRKNVSEVLNNSRGCMNVNNAVNIASGDV